MIQIAERLNIPQPALNNRKRRFSKFREAAEMKKIAQFERVTKEIQLLAEGYEYDEVRTLCERVAIGKVPVGKNSQGGDLYAPLFSGEFQAVSRETISKRRGNLKKTFIKPRTIKSIDDLTEEELEAVFNDLETKIVALETSE